ncbi:hypothetical protein PORY_000968 [Pneumocystis oryctolagi]|uniref:Uncharacterized protein n=1 Tax=Pneumocystis oryctolagi TaxID=42067 RepID=A0ACB7CFW2_9ASCO|nr:hypothetical protein PORY_000968 [Pneumocystis oryctolagi]
MRCCAPRALPCAGRADGAAGELVTQRAGPALDNAACLRKRKKYLSQGLYAFLAGRTKGCSTTRSATHSAIVIKKILPLPMYNGVALMDNVRDFKLPWNLFATSSNACRPLGWKCIKKNIYDKEKVKPIVRPKCNCKQDSECKEGCLNRALFYECDDVTCALDNPKECTNRAFQRYTEKRLEGKLSSLNVEVVWTGKCGYGLRSLRDFDPGSLVVEYCGEVIEKSELFCRINGIYKNFQNYYFLNFNAGLVLDAGLKGSEARFINHSCQPNCKIEKWYVHGIPRIGVFVGEAGLSAGEDITYDYNFRKVEIQSGALVFTESTQEEIKENDIKFQLRYAPFFMKKKKDTEICDQQSRVNPFDPPEPLLYVQDIGNDYCIILNKFPIVPKHFLLITKEFRKQTEGLSINDIVAIFECLNSMKDKHIAFYNSGPQSGASQPHKHIQFISFKESNISSLYPEDVLENTTHLNTPWSHPKIPFIHYIFPIASYSSPVDLINMFSELLSLTMKAIQVFETDKISYNFAMTKQWMFITPRTTESWNHISVNTVGMLGMFLVKSQEELNLVKNTGILKILKQLGVNKNEK